MRQHRIRKSEATAARYMRTLPGFTLSVFSVDAQVDCIWFA